MMPLGYCSMRSTVMWVLPVFVGPSTAVTPRLRSEGGWIPGAWKASFMRDAPCARSAVEPLSSARIGTVRRVFVHTSNGMGTNRARIGDSP